MGRTSKAERRRAKHKAKKAAAAPSPASASADDEGMQKDEGMQNAMSATDANDGMQTTPSALAVDDGMGNGEDTQNAPSATKEFYLAQNKEGMQNAEGPQNAASPTNESTTNTAEAQNEDAATPLPQIVHNKQCETCGFGGRMICCSACNLVFHLGCTRPRLALPPVGHWFCAYCITSDSSATATEKQSATLFAAEVTKLKKEALLKQEAEAALLKRSSPVDTDPDVPSTKRPRSSPSVENIETTIENRSATTTDEATAGNTQSPTPTPDTIPNDAKKFVDLFFLKGKEKQEELLKAILTDQRVTEVLPEESTVATKTQNQSNGTSLNYHNQMIDISDPTKYWPLQHNAFHWFPPNTNNGVH